MIHIKYLWDKSEVNIHQALDLIANNFEVIIWASNDLNDEGSSIKIIKNKKLYEVYTATNKYTCKTPLDALNRAIMGLLLWY